MLLKSFPLKFAISAIFLIPFEFHSINASATSISAADLLSSAITSGEISGQDANNAETLYNVYEQMSITQKATLVSQVQGLTINSVQEAVEMALPDLSGAATSNALTSSSMSSNEIRLHTRHLSSGDSVATKGVWAQVLAGESHQGTRDGISGYDANSRGFVAGVDGTLKNGLLLGFAYSMSNTDSKSDTSSIKSNYNILTAYTGYSIGRILLDGQIYYAFGDNKEKRLTGAKGDYDSQLYGVHGGAGYQFDLSDLVQFIPTVSVDYSHLNLDNYNESGTEALYVDSQDYEHLELGLSGELSSTIQLDKKTLFKPHVNLGVYHDFKDDTQSVTAALAIAPTTSFTVEGADPQQTRYTAGFGLTLLHNENFSTDFEYTYNWQSNFHAQIGSIKVRYNF